MRKIILCGVMAVCMVASVFAAEEAVTDDGREVLLKDDGSWEFKSNDRFATAPDGRRVRLKADGSWRFTGETDTGGPQGQVALNRAAPAGGLTLNLERLVIETARESSTTSHKNTRKTTNSVFYIDITTDKEAMFSLDSGLFSVSDSSGRDYRVLSVRPAQLALRAGGSRQVEVRVDGSPHWFTIKTLSVTIDKQVFGGDRDTRLVGDMDRAEKVSVDTL